MNDIDNIIKKIVSEKIEKPIQYRKSIENALYRENSEEKHWFYRNNFSKAACATCACLVIGSGVILAKDIPNLIKKYFNTSEGINTAINNGYILMPNMNYIESNGTQVKVNNMLMDDFNFNLTFSIKLEENIKSEDVTKMELVNMIITDEENRILYCQDIDTFNNYCKENNLDYKYGEFNENYINNGSSYYIYSRDNELNTLNLVYSLYSNQYPRSKKISISFSQININEDTILKGDWNMTVDVPEKFYNREADVYSVTNCSDPFLNITDATIYDTCMKLEFNTKVQQIYNENDTEEERKEKKEKFKNFGYETGSKFIKFVSNEYIEDSNGNKYYPSEHNSEDAGTIYSPTGELYHYQTFNFTKYDMTDNIKIYLTINTMEGSKDIIINLSRK